MGFSILFLGDPYIMLKMSRRLYQSGDNYAFIFFPATNNYAKHTPHGKTDYAKYLPHENIKYWAGARMARIYDDEVRKWVLGTGIEAIEEKLWISREGPPTFDQQKLPLRCSLGMEGYSRNKSLGIMKMILREWKIQWEILDIVEEPRQIVEQNSFKVQHLAVVIANSAYSKSEVQEYKQFEHLPANCRRILNMDKAQIASLRIKTRKIKDINSKYGPRGTPPWLNADDLKETKENHERAAEKNMKE
ncbi:hypothetical protein RDI58_007307 [Solanum bulbocastanum]|uniref:Ribulose bisphosphate carboxylase/oxygenase activase AAA helical domain-containing protein n=1 Tax=Solanum bulbocastanum TaxID=147425 RepID=A0AAN8YHK8_SOLBU